MAAMPRKLNRPHPDTDRMRRTGQHPPTADEIADAGRRRRAANTGRQSHSPPPDTPA